VPPDALAELEATLARIERKVDALTLRQGRPAPKPPAQRPKRPVVDELAKKRADRFLRRRGL
jgi:hypothetical protein